MVVGAAGASFYLPARRNLGPAVRQSSDAGKVLPGKVEKYHRFHDKPAGSSQPGRGGSQAAKSPAAPRLRTTTKVRQLGYILGKRHGPGTYPGVISTWLDQDKLSDAGSAAAKGDCEETPASEMGSTEQKTRTLSTVDEDARAAAAFRRSWPLIRESVRAATTSISGKLRPDLSGPGAGQPDQRPENRGSARFQPVRVLLFQPDLGPGKRFWRTGPWDRFWTNTRVISGGDGVQRHGTVGGGKSCVRNSGV